MADDLSSGSAQSGENAGNADGANAGELTQDALSAALNSENGTAANQTSQQGNEGDGDKGTEGQDAGNSGDGQGDGEHKPTPQEEAVAAQRKADLLRIAQLHGLDGDYDTVEALEQALRDRETQQHEDDLEADTTALYNQTLREIAASAKASPLKVKAYDAEGNEIEAEVVAGDEWLQATVYNALNKLRPEIRRIEAGETFADLGAAAMDLLPDDAQEPFGKAIAGGLGVRAWVEQLVEHAAPASKWGKAQAAEKDAHGKAEYLRGWEDRGNAPMGQASQNGGRGAAAVSISGKTPQEVAGLLESGELNFEKALADAWAST